MLGISSEVLGIACVMCCMAGLALRTSPFFGSTIENLLSYSTLCDILSVRLLLLLIAFAWVNRTHKREKWIR